MLEGYGFVIVGSDAGPVVDDFDGIKAIVLEANLWPRNSQMCKTVWGLAEILVPMEVAWASRLFSTNSLTTEMRPSPITWPDWIW